MQRRHCIFMSVLAMVSVRVLRPDLQPERRKGHLL